MKRKVAHLTSAHPPDDIRILLKECKALDEAGYEVHLVARAKPGFVSDFVVHSPLKPSKSRLDRFTRLVGQTFFKAMATKADLFHLHDPELLLVGVLLKLFGKKVIYDAHEDYPKAVGQREWIPKKLRFSLASSFNFFEQSVTRFLDGVVAATPAIESRFEGRPKVCVQNYPIVGELLHEDGVPFAMRPPWVTYLGAISELRGVNVICKAMDLLSVDKEMGHSVQLKLAGSFDSQQHELAFRESTNGKKIDFLGQLNRHQARALLGQSRMGLVIFQPAENHIESQPNKLFEYLSAGLPIVASNFPLWREIVEGNGVGIVVDPTNSQEVADAISFLLKNPELCAEMGGRARALIEARLNWNVEARKLIEFYRRIGLGAL